MKYLLSILLVAITTSPSFVEGAGFGDPGRELWIGHGILMFLAWGVVFPVGALIAVYRRHVGETGTIFRKSPSFYPPHFYFQVTGIIMNIVAMILAARANFLVYGTGNPFDDVNLNFTTDFFPWNRHVKLGLATLALLIIQSILGYVHHLIKHRHDDKKKNGEITEPWKRWIVPSWAHVILGPIVMFVAFLTIVQGLQIFSVIFHWDELKVSENGKPPASIRFGIGMIGVIACLFLISYVMEKYRIFKERKRTVVANDVPSSKETKQ